MPAWGIAAIVIGVVVLDVVVVFGIVVPAIVRGSWGALAVRFPAVEAGPGAVRREFQSFKFGLLNLGWSVHVEVDDAYLHLRPALMARLMGCRAMSVPWEEVRATGARFLGNRSVMIGQTRVSGPAWCLDLAGGGSGGG